MRDGLEGYAAAPQASADGRSLTLPLSGSYRLKHFRIGTKVVIDLQQAAAEGPATENPGAVTAEALPQVRVRGGRHDGFSRLVFDWETPVGELLEQGAQGEGPRRVRLLFDRPAQLDLSAVDPARLPQTGTPSPSPAGVPPALPPPSDNRPL